MGLSDTGVAYKVWHLLPQHHDIPYNNKFWRRTKFGELANRHEIAKFKFRQYCFIPHYL